MFFLGGINSILPYLIYLTLIWVFIIVSFGNKVNSFFNENNKVLINKEYSILASAKEAKIFPFKKIQKDIKEITFLYHIKQCPIRKQFCLLNDFLFLTNKINSDKYRAPPNCSYQII